MGFAAKFTAFMVSLSSTILTTNLYDSPSKKKLCDTDFSLDKH